MGKQKSGAAIGPLRILSRTRSALGHHVLACRLCSRAKALNACPAHWRAQPSTYFVTKTTPQRN